MPWKVYRPWSQPDLGLTRGPGTSWVTGTDSTASQRMGLLLCPEDAGCIHPAGWVRKTGMRGAWHVAGA